MTIPASRQTKVQRQSLLDLRARRERRKNLLRRLLIAAFVVGMIAFGLFLVGINTGLIVPPL